MRADMGTGHKSPTFPALPVECCLFLVVSGLLGGTEPGSSLIHPLDEREHRQGEKPWFWGCSDTGTESRAWYQASVPCGTAATCCDFGG